MFGAAGFRCSTAPRNCRPLQGAELTLRAGQQINLQASGAGAVQAFDVLQPGWREGVLMANNQPLGISCVNSTPIAPAFCDGTRNSKRWRDRAVSRLDDTDRILALLCASLPLEVQRRTRYWVTLLPRKKVA